MKGVSIQSPSESEVQRVLVELGFVPDTFESAAKRFFDPITGDGARIGVRWESTRSSKPPTPVWFVTWIPQGWDRV